MTLLVPWLAFPVVLGVLCLGCGLLVEQIAGRALPGALRLPVGLAAIIVLAQFTTMGSGTAPFTIPLVFGATVAGFGLSLGQRIVRPSPWAGIAAAATYAVYAAPVVLSGRATFTGYVKLDDTATFLGFTDQLMKHGRNLSGLAPSTFQVMLKLNIGEGYPVGTFLPLGIGSKLTGQDPAWVYQPCMAFYAAMATLTLYSLTRGVIRRGWLRAVVSFLAAQAALLYAFALWGGIKEILATAMIGLAAALVPVRSDELRNSRALIPFAVTIAATLGVLSVTGMLWIGLLCIPALVALVRGGRRSLRPALSCVAIATLLSIPSLLTARAFLHYSRSNLLTEPQRLGNLVHPLKFVQIFGIWITGDFRYTPTEHTVTWVLITVCALAAVGTAAYVVRRHQIRLVLPAAALAVSIPLLNHESSPWLVGKALAEGSVFVVLLAVTCGALLIQSGRRVEGTALMVALAIGVLWSNVLGYRAAWLAPRSQLAELQQIGARFSGGGPALMTEYQPYGVRHFLRNLDTEGASELRVRQVPLASGGSLPKAGYADLDAFAYPDILTYRTLVLRRSPVESRPSAPYALAWEGTYYDVWQRPLSGGPTVLQHIPLGSDDGAVAVPSCDDVKAAAAKAEADNAILAVAGGSNPVLVPLGASDHPASWSTFAGSPNTITPAGDGTLRTTVVVPRSATYSVWLSGTFFRDVSISVDGVHVGSVPASGAQYVEFGALPLQAGSHDVVLTYGGDTLAPGDAAPGFAIGPIAFQVVAPPADVEYVEPTDAPSVCGRALDWIEIVGR